MLLWCSLVTFGHYKHIAVEIEYLIVLLEFTFSVLFLLLLLLSLIEKKNKNKQPLTWKIHFKWHFNNMLLCAIDFSNMNSMRSKFNFKLNLILQC